MNSNNSNAGFVWITRRIDELKWRLVCHDKIICLEQKLKKNFLTWRFLWIWSSYDALDEKAGRKEEDDEPNVASGHHVCKENESIINSDKEESGFVC